MRVVVVGAGLGGLSAACHLAGRGHEVTVLERDATPGGRAGTLALGGYRFDTGPTVLTMPSIIEATFAAAGADMADLLELTPVDPLYRATFSDGSAIAVRSGREAMANEVRRVCGSNEALAFQRFADWLTQLFALEMPAFIDRDYNSVLDLAGSVRPLVQLVRLGGLRRLSSRVADFFRDERLRRVFSFQSMYAGLAPYEALALYGVITYMDTIGGVYHANGGAHALAVALASAAEKAGAVLRYDTPVDRVLLRDGACGPVQGVTLGSGERIAADAVVCNPELPAAYRTLLPGLRAPRATRVGRYSPSAFVWHAGVRGELPPSTAHHNVHFGPDWDASFRALLEDGTRMSSPSIFVTAATVDEPAAAPPGCHSLFVLEPVPNLDGRVDWHTERGRAREQLARRIAELGYPADVEVESVVDPVDWARAGMERGTPFSLSHRFFQTGPFRPRNLDRRAPGLVFVGSGTVPGVGVPMVLISGRLAADRVEAAR